MYAGIIIITAGIVAIVLWMITGSTTGRRRNPEDFGRMYNRIELLLVFGLVLLAVAIATILHFMA